MDTERPETMVEDDVVELLIHQHATIRDLFAEVNDREGQERRDAWERLVRLLAVHETIEVEIVHPMARRSIAGGDGVVSDCLDEENHAKHLLSELDGKDPDTPEFLTLLASLRVEVLEHARSEERYELAHLAQVSDARDRSSMASMAKAAAALAPTHPHPGAESATANVLVGTPMGMMDRARDVLRKARP